MDPPIFYVWSQDDVIQGKFGRKTFHVFFTRIEVPRFQKCNKQAQIGMDPPMLCTQLKKNKKSKTIEKMNLETKFNLETAPNLT